MKQCTSEGINIFCTPWKPNKGKGIHLTTLSSNNKTGKYMSVKQLGFNQSGRKKIIQLEMAAWFITALGRKK